MNDPFATDADEAQTEAPVDTPADSPFDEPPADAPKKAAAKKAAPKKAAAKKAADDDEEDADFHPYTLSLKGHSGFDAPLLVMRGKSITHLADQFENTDGAELARLMRNASRAAKYFTEQFPDQGAQKGGGGNRGGGNSGGGQRSGQPQASQEAPNGEKRFCAHGEMRFKSDVSKAGKPYKGFFCTSRDRSDQCDAQFLR